MRMHGSTGSNQSSRRRKQNRIREEEKQNKNKLDATSKQQQVGGDGDDKCVGYTREITNKGVTVGALSSMDGESELEKSESNV